MNAILCLLAATLVARWNGFTGLTAENDLAPDKGLAQIEDNWKFQLNGGAVNADGSLSTGTGVAPRILFNGTQYQAGGSGLGGFTVVMEAVPAADFTAGKPLWEWFANDDKNSVGVILTSAAGIRGEWAKGLWNNTNWVETAVNFPAAAADSSVIATICDANGTQVYWDGASVVSVSGLKGSTMGSGDSFFAFGNFAAATSGGNDFVIRRVAVWNGALTAAEIADDPFGDNVVIVKDYQVPPEGTNITGTVAFTSLNSIIYSGALPGTLALENIPSFNPATRLVIEEAATLAPGVYPLVTWTQKAANRAGYGRPTLDKSAFANPERVELYCQVQGLTLLVKSAEQMARPPLVIAPLGDSITEGYTPNNCGANYRVQLMQKLSLLGYNPVSVGEWSGNKNVLYTRDPSGEACTNAWWYHSGVSSRRLGGWANVRSATFLESVENIMNVCGNCDVVLLHIGVNDTNIVTPQQNFENLTNCVGRILRNNPNTKVVMSSLLSILLMHGETKNTNWVVAMNDKVKEFAANGFFGDGRVSFVDLYEKVPAVTGNTNYNFTSDGLHPDWCGHDKKSDGWLEAVTNLFKNVGADTVQADGSPLASAAGIPALPTAAELGAAAHAELDAYRAGLTLSRVIELQDSQHFAKATPTYDYASSDIAEDAQVGKVGYFLDLVRKDNHVHTWIWVDFDGYEKFSALTVPTTVNNDRQVERLHVYSNHTAVHNVAADDDSVRGKILFTPYNYSAGAKYSNYDWGNTATTAGGYGAMQLYRLSPPDGGRNLGAEVLFAWNRWGTANSGATEIGIGDYGQLFGYVWYSLTSSLEYTGLAAFPMLNDAAYEVKRLEIWSRPAYPAKMIVR